MGWIIRTGSALLTTLVMAGCSNGCDDKPTKAEIKRARSSCNLEKRDTRRTISMFLESRSRGIFYEELYGKCSSNDIFRLRSDKGYIIGLRKSVYKRSCQLLLRKKKREALDKGNYSTYRLLRNGHWCRDESRMRRDIRTIKYLKI